MNNSSHLMIVFCGSDLISELFGGVNTNCHGKNNFLNFLTTKYTDPSSYALEFTTVVVCVCVNFS